MRPLAYQWEKQPDVGVDVLRATSGEQCERTRHLLQAPDLKMTRCAPTLHRPPTASSMDMPSPILEVHNTKLM